MRRFRAHDDEIVSAQASSNHLTLPAFEPTKDAFEYSLLLRVVVGELEDNVVTAAAFFDFDSDLCTRRCFVHMLTVDLHRVNDLL